MTQQNHKAVDLQKLKVKLFADGAAIGGIIDMYANPLIKGFTTNPTLMNKVGILDYKAFSQEVLSVVVDRPVSLEVFADDFDEMAAQAREIASWGENVYVKIPVTNTLGEFAGALINELSNEGITLNVTAIMGMQQVRDVVKNLALDTPAIVSVFAGRIADTGVDPVPFMKECVDILSERPKAELLWASPRELLNIFQADEIGCQIITATNDILKKLSLVGKNLEDYSLETVKMFYNDAVSAGYKINTSR